MRCEGRATAAWKPGFQPGSVGTLRARLTDRTQAVERKALRTDVSQWGTRYNAT
jgi:hypothetical protein